jgi:hypothetical protein
VSSIIRLRLLFYDYEMFFYGGLGGLLFSWEIEGGVGEVFIDL